MTGVPAEKKALASDRQTKPLSQKDPKTASAPTGKRKTFTLIGSDYECIREVLLARGWVERNPMLNEPVDFFWARSRKQINFRELPEHTVVNYFDWRPEPGEPGIGAITSKWGLAATLTSDRAGWEGLCDPVDFFPRCYDLKELGGQEAFEIDFKWTAAEAILKRTLEFGVQGIVAATLEAMEIALRVVKQKLSHLNFLQEDDSCSEEAVEAHPSLSQAQWDVLLNFPGFSERPVKSEPLRQLTPDEAEISRFAQLESEAKSILERLAVKCPQSAIDGLHNVWISKPASASRGRKIQCFNTLSHMKNLMMVSERSGVMPKKWQAARDKLLERQRQRQQQREAEGDVRARFGRDVTAKASQEIRNPVVLKRLEKQKQHQERIELGKAQAEDAGRRGSMAAVEGQQMRWVVQKYIERPMTMGGGRKCDIRQAVLVSSWNPVTIWMYSECYMRICEDAFDPYDVHNVYGQISGVDVGRCTSETQEGYHATELKDGQQDIFSHGGDAKAASLPPARHAGTAAIVAHVTPERWRDKVAPGMSWPGCVPALAVAPGMSQPGCVQALAVAPGMTGLGGAGSQLPQE
ncbi:hypothetical protein CYMTET_20735 [Cymbomonas tetramitiformis]|uniref:Uncharacterized protein n=1 Tax=Cymbomonas tetramitiformis TaxID=36881 RepID=A0AAE0L3P6_9CHLO|nr:hypothetical protein CYMTET_20735 [Cymbomonas tetramitiformis]